MKQYDVTAVHPETGREETFLMVSENTLVQNEHGETMFKYNSRVQWEVVSVKLVPQARVDATRKYFEKYGTANEQLKNKFAICDCYGTMRVQNERK